MIRKSILLTLLLCTLAGLGQTPSRVVTTTRLVAIFSQLENDLLKAIQQKDQATLDRLLSEDFQAWTPAPPGEPVPREDWLPQAMSTKVNSFRIRQMAVRSLNGSTAVVSFVLSQTVERAGKRQTSNFFMVDVWQKSGDNWQVTDRYSSPVAGLSKIKQGQAKPTGKD